MTLPETLDEGNAKLVARRYPWRWVAAVIVLVLAAMMVHTLVANPRWKWDVVGEYLFSPESSLESATHYCSPSWP